MFYFKKHKSIILLVLFLVSSLFVFPQTKKQLESNKTKIEKEIRELNKQISETKNVKNSSSKNIKLLQSRIKEREKLIININAQIVILDDQIVATKKDINNLVLQIDSLKSEYAKVIRMLYKKRSLVDKTVLIFNAKDFNQAYQRLRYFGKYNQYRKMQLEEILKKEHSLEMINNTLQNQKQEQSGLLKQEQVQKSKLASEEEINKKKLVEVQKKEKQLAEQLKKKQREVEALRKKIQKIIEEEVRKAEEARKKKLAEEKKKNKNNTNTKPSKTTYTISSTPEEIALSNSFTDNKAKLPWPVEKGTVTRSFGEYTHESGTKNMNNGLEILTTTNASARSVFNGEVSKIFNDPNGQSKVVIIKHGEYFTVYTNLKNLTVKEGSKVTTKQVIGTIAANSIDNKSEINFQLWKGKIPQNPGSWLTPKK